MKRKPFGLALLVALVCGFTLATHAMEEVAPEAAAEEVTLTGTMTCAKCDLGEGDACQSVLIVGEGDEKTTYYIASKEKHAKVCKEAVDGVTVTGTVAEAEDGKKTLTASKIEMPAAEAEA